MTEPTRARKLVLTAASTIEPEPVVWAWEDNGYGRIPAGALTVAAGREGTGKSSFGIWMAAQITKGTLPGSFYGRPHAVIYGAIEDSWKYTLVPRLIAAGADLSKVFRVEVLVDENEHGSLCLPVDISLLEKEITAHDVALLVLDPLMSTIGAGIDTHKERDTRTALDPLARLADRARCMVLGIAHFSKGSSADASSLITGSGAFKNVPRAVFGFARDPEDGVSVLTQTKNSLGHGDLPSLTYEIQEAKVPTRKGVASVGKFVFTGESERSVNDILSANGGDTEDDRTDAAAWLKSYLADNGDEADVIEILKAGDKVGFSKDSLKRAKKKAGVVSRKEDMDSAWMWVLAAAKGAKGAKGGAPRDSLPSALPSSDDQSAGTPKGARRARSPREPLPSLPSRSSLPSDVDEPTLFDAPGETS